MTNYIVYLIITFYSLEPCPNEGSLFIAPDKCNYFYEKEQAVTVMQGFETFTEAEEYFEVLREDIYKVTNSASIYQLSIYDGNWYNFDGSYKTICQEQNFIE